nr:MAG TPA: hypothetical protein [Bacteriophage sp.]
MIFYIEKAARRLLHLCSFYHSANYFITRAYLFKELLRIFGLNQICKTVQKLFLNYIFVINIYLTYAA